MTPPAGVVFDLDGTLVLTEGRNAVVWRSFFEANGVGYDDELAHHVMGRRAQDSLVELMHLFPDRPMHELVREVADIDMAVPLSDVQPVAGAVHLVRRLADAGMPLALVTSAGRGYAHGLLRELGLLDAFATSVTGEDVSRGKPGPGGILGRLRQFEPGPSAGCRLRRLPRGGGCGEERGHGLRRRGHHPTARPAGRGGHRDRRLRGSGAGGLAARDRRQRMKES